jgi:release factor glutamine methyltransferase
MGAATDAVVRRLRDAGCVFAEEEAALLLAEASDPQQLEAMIRARVDGRPLEQLLGWVAFRGHRLVVDEGVFVPRQRTGLLVELASARLHEGATVVELCCGVAPVGAALLAEWPGRLELWASDIDPVAVRSARRNLEPLGGTVVVGDLFGGLPDHLRGYIDVLVANAPYVPSASIALMPREARDHEAAIALDGGADGLDVQRRLIAASPEWLPAGAHLVVETSTRQAERTAGLMESAGYSAVIRRDEELDGTAVEGVRR